MNQLKQYFLGGIVLGVVLGSLFGAFLCRELWISKQAHGPQVAQEVELGEMPIPCRALEGRINVTDSVLSAEITRLNNLLGVLAPWSQGVNARLDSLTAICQGLK